MYSSYEGVLNYIEEPVGRGAAERIELRIYQSGRIASEAKLFLEFLFLYQNRFGDSRWKFHTQFHDTQMNEKRLYNDTS